MAKRDDQFKPNVVDAVYREPSSDEYGLALIERRPWGSVPDHKREIQRKINFYLSFALDGQLEKMHPNAKGRLVTIHLLYEHEPDTDWRAFFKEIEVRLKEYGLGFVAERVP